MAIDIMTQRIINELAEHPTAEVEVFAGMKKISGEFEDGTADFRPDGSKTVVLKIKGGANNVRVERIKIEGED